MQKHSKKFIYALIVVCVLIPGASLARRTGGIISHAFEKPATTPEAAVQKVCRGCHDMEIVTDTPKSYDEWTVTVQETIDRGAVGTPKEYDLVMDYLYKNMTTINVNQATADDLGVILGAPDSVVQAIIARRQTRPFKDMADLQTVPGTDRPALEAKQKMIFFN